MFNKVGGRTTFACATSCRSGSDLLKPCPWPHVGLEAVAIRPLWRVKSIRLDYEVLRRLQQGIPDRLCQIATHGRLTPTPLNSDYSVLEDQVS